MYRPGFSYLHFPLLNEKLSTAGTTSVDRRADITPIFGMLFTWPRKSTCTVQTKSATAYIYKA